VKNKFKSGFAERLCKFLAQKNALGILYNGFDRYLAGFDEMCSVHYPIATVLTKEICMEWAVKRPTEGNNTFRNRISPIREFARFLVRNGEPAYIIPNGIIRKLPCPTPYIYTKEEVAKIWEAFDLITPKSRYPTRHLVMSAIVRVLYCCGLRPGEARNLKTADTDLNNGRLFIRESKGHNDRIVMMAEDVADYIRSYDEKMRKILPERKWFFSNENGDRYDPSWMNRNFNDIRNRMNFQALCGVLPRLYDFRHTFATHRLYEWLQDGRDLNAMLPYLSAYMGHAQLSDTYYYIHLVPGQYEAMSGLDFSKYNDLLPEVDYGD